MNRREFLTGLTGLMIFPNTALASPEPFPDITGKDDTNQLIELKPLYQRKKTVINMWYAGCGICIKEIPKLNILHTRINVISLGVITSEEHNNLEDTQREITYLKKYQETMTHPHVIIGMADYKKLENLYRYQHPDFKGLLMFPTFFLIDSNGLCTYSRMGALLDNFQNPTSNYTSLEQAIAKAK